VCAIFTDAAESSAVQTLRGRAPMQPNARPVVAGHRPDRRGDRHPCREPDRAPGGAPRSSSCIQPNGYPEIASAGFIRAWRLVAPVMHRQREPTRVASLKVRRFSAKACKVTFRQRSGRLEVRHPWAGARRVNIERPKRFWC
jgi:hypothetical protein